MNRNPRCGIPRSRWNHSRPRRSATRSTGRSRRSVPRSATCWACSSRWWRCCSCRWSTWGSSASPGGGSCCTPCRRRCSSGEGAGGPRLILAKGLLFIAPLIAGSIIVLLMFKPLFARPVADGQPLRDRAFAGAGTLPARRADRRRRRRAGAPPHRADRRSERVRVVPAAACSASSGRTSRCASACRS